MIKVITCDLPIDPKTGKKKFGLIDRINKEVKDYLFGPDHPMGMGSFINCTIDGHTFTNADGILMCYFCHGNMAGLQVTTRRKEGLHDCQISIEYPEILECDLPIVKAIIYGEVEDWMYDEL